MFGNLNIYNGRNVKQFKTIAPMKIKNFLWSYYGIAEKEQKAAETEVSAEHFKKGIVFLKYVWKHVIIL